MATQNSIPESIQSLTSQARAVNYVYQLKTEVGDADILDHLATRLMHLNALLEHVCTTQDQFFTLSDELKSSYLWACQSLAKECAGLVNNLDVADVKQAALLAKED